MTFAVLRFAGKAPVKSEWLKFSTSLTEISFFKSFLISPVGFLNLKKKYVTNLLPSFCRCKKGIWIAVFLRCQRNSFALI